MFGRPATSKGSNMDIDGLVKECRRRGLMADDNMGDAEVFDAAANALETLQRENSILRAERRQAIAQREFCVKVLTRIHSFITPEGIALPDGRRFEFNNPAIEHEMLKALSAAIRAVPDELEKANSAQPEDEWHGY